MVIYLSLCIVGILFSFFLLWIAGSFAVKYSVLTADMFNLNTLFVGFVLISISTGFPELAVVIMSLLRGADVVSVGTILGSNLSDISLVIGLPVLIYGGVLLNKKDIKDSLLIILVTFSSMILIFIFKFVD